MAFNKIVPEMLPIASQTEVNAGTSDVTLVTPKTIIARITQMIANMLTTANFASITDTTSSDKVETPAGSQYKVDTLSIVVNEKINSLPLTVFKKGMIMMWSGDINDIPDDWLLCDGTNNTPNLTDRFIVGAGSGFSIGNYGGANTHTHTATSSISISGSIAGAALTIAQIPSHTHTIPLASSVSEYFGNNYVRGSTTGNTTIASSSVGSGQAHTHGFSGSGSANVSVASAGNLPPYYALAFIMKS